MISDSIPNASIALASSNPKDFAKKKRVNRSARLKQCKLDARREQWLSQAKNKGACKEELSDERGACGGRREGLENKRSMPIEKLEIKPRVEEEIYLNGLPRHHFSDSESSPSNSSSGSLLGRTESGGNFTESSQNGSSSGRSSSCSANCCFLGSMSEEDEGGIGDDGCLDDWEAVADALAATEDKKQEHSHNSAQCGSQLSVTNPPFCGSDISNAKQQSGGTSVQSSLVNCRAWRPDDAFRPQSLPSLSKNYSFQLGSGRHFGSVGSVWGCKNLDQVPASCPICYEDFDCTDSSFIPCLCGFRLCLFCHKRILEEDGRCPGCRKQYNRGSVEGEAALNGGSLTFRLAHSCSMVTGS